MRPDKKKIIDEVWNEDRIKSFLKKEVPKQSGINRPGEPDFHTLLNAYNAMRIHDFIVFLDHFINRGGDLSATNSDGKTLANYLIPHKKAQPFIKALEARRQSRED